MVAYRFVRKMIYSIFEFMDRLWLFIISKVPETIDTLFIVLRRQQLIFLHWFHHASVLIYCFYR
jgi:hypothetical protein